jgi:hypothetical protein
VIDVRDPTHCVRVGRYDTSGYAMGVAVVRDRVYVADGQAGLVVLDSWPSRQPAVRVDGAMTGVRCVIEASLALAPAAPWRPVLTNASPNGPFDFVDLDSNVAEQPQKFYRAHQP